MAGVARRELELWADKERAEERRERRRRRGAEVAGCSEDGMDWLEGVRVEGMEACEWLVSGWAV